MRSRTVEKLARVAAIYRGNEQAPTQAVADRLGISHTAAANLVARARSAGLLPATTRGKAALDTSRI